MRPRLGNCHPFVGQDIRTLIALRAQTSGGKPFIVWEPFHGESYTWTYAQFADKVARFAAGLAKRGVRPTERVLVHLDNCPEAILAWFGCAAMGAVAVTTNARSSGDELNYYADASGAVAAITQPRFAELVGRSCRNVRWLAVTETDNGEAAGATRPEPAFSFAKIDDEPASLPRRAHDPLAPFSIQYTSGTTSRPKAVLWTHANALWGAKVCADARGPAGRATSTSSPAALPHQRAVLLGAGGAVGRRHRACCSRASRRRASGRCR